MIPALIVLYITGFMIFYYIARDDQLHRGLPTEEVPWVSMMYARMLYATLWPLALVFVLVRMIVR